MVTLACCGLKHSAQTRSSRSLKADQRNKTRRSWARTTSPPRMRMAGKRRTPRHSTLSSVPSLHQRCPFRDIVSPFIPHCKQAVILPFFSLASGLPRKVHSTRCSRRPHAVVSSIQPNLQGSLSLGFAHRLAATDCEMPQLAADKNVKAWIETRPMKEANQATVDLTADKPR